MTTFNWLKFRIKLFSDLIGSPLHYSRFGTFFVSLFSQTWHERVTAQQKVHLYWLYRSLYKATVVAWKNYSWVYVAFKCCPTSISAHFCDQTTTHRPSYCHIFPSAWEACCDVCWNYCTNINLPICPSVNGLVVWSIKLQKILRNVFPLQADIF